MREYYQMMDEDPFQVLPYTFLVKNNQDEEFKRFLEYFAELE